MAPEDDVARRGNLARTCLAVVALAVAWLAFDHHLGARRVSRAREANLRQRLRETHRAHPVRSGETAFLGDSITFDGDWAAAFPGLPARNRGIGWDTTDDLLERLDDSLDGPPATVVLMIGTNDLPLGIPHARTVRNVSLVLDRVAEAAPDARVVVQSVLPRADRYHPLVAPLNEALARVCGDRGLAFVDHTERFAGPDGRLDPEVHDDGIHPNAEGHRRLAEGLAPLLEAPAVRPPTPRADPR